MKTNICLIGMMGTSKTTSGKLLADRLELRFLDVDALIEYEDLPIPELFSRFGEEYFREIESAKLARVAEYENLVIATGGGAVLNPGNMRRLSASCYFVWLKATPRAILGRVKRQAGRRPLLAAPTLKSVEELLSAREPLYAKWADVAVDTTGKTPEKIVGEICAGLGAYLENKNREGNS